MVVSEAAHFGGSRALTLAAEYFLACRNERCSALDPSAAEFPVHLSKATRHRRGGPVHIIANTSPADVLPVLDRVGGAVTTIAPGKLREFYLLDNSTQAGSWLVGDEHAFQTSLVGGGVSAITFGDGSTLVYTLTHGLGTKALLVGLWDAGSPYAGKEATVEAISTTQVRVTVATPPGSNALRIVLATTAMAASLVGVDFGDGSSTSLSVIHALGSRDIVAQVRETAGAAPFVFPTVEAASTSAAGVTAALAPASGALRLLAALADVSVTFGDTSTLVYPLTHGLGTRDIVAAVRLAASPYTFVAATIEATDGNTVTVTVATPPGTNALTLHVIG